MKKLTVLITVLTIANSIAAFAMNTSDAQSATPATITCPKIIKCSANNVASCKAIGDNLEYWGKIYIFGQEKKGTYYFQQAQTTHHASSAHKDISVCKYPLRMNSNEGGYLSLHAKENTWLEASSSTPTNWKVGRFYQANCFIPKINPLGKDPELCSFNKIPLIGVTLNTSERIILFAHNSAGYLINRAPIISSPLFPTAVITMYETWGSCSQKGPCTIDLMAKRDGHGKFKIGSVVLDMGNQMKILTVNPDPSTGYEIIKPTSDNAIEIRQIKVGG